MKKDKKMVNTEQDDKKNLEKQEVKKEKINRFFDEFKACLILVAIICSVIAVSCIWYMEIKNKNSNEQGESKVASENGYKYVSYETKDDNTLKVLGNKYVLLSDDTSVLKVMDLDLNVLYENEEVFTNCFVAEDGKLYFYKEDEENGSNAISLYRLEGKDIKEVKELYNEGAYYRPIYKKIENEDYIIGYDGIFYGYDEDNNEVRTDYIYLLNGQEYELTNMTLLSNWLTLAVNDPLYLYDDANVLYMDEDGKYGVFDIINNTKVVEANYDFLRAIEGTDNFVAVKDKKAGIIDIKLKKIVDYMYDFIDANEDFFVVGKNNKLAIMDSSYKLVTDFVFDHQASDDTIGYLYDECCGNYNTFEAYKLNDKYLLITNYLEEYIETSYDKHEAYLIDKNGKYQTINENNMIVDLDNKIMWIYDEKTKQYTFYDLDYNELYKIDINDYDFERMPDLEIIYNTIFISFMESDLYYDLKTGQALENVNDYEEKVLDDVTIRYNGKDKKAMVMLNDKEIYNYKYGSGDLSYGYDYIKLYNIINDKQVIFSDGQVYFMIRKGD